MSYEALLNTKQQDKFWPWLMGAVTFAITTLFPPLGQLRINYALIPDWLDPIVVYGSAGGIGWQLLRYVQENAAALYPLPALLVMILPFCTVPIILPLCSVLMWRRVVQRAPYPTIGRALLAVVLATALSLLIIGLLDLLILGSLTLSIPDKDAGVLGMAIFAIAALGQSLWFLPSLLIAGAILALLQARASRFRTAQTV